MRNEDIYKLLEERDKKFDAQLDSLNKTIRYGLKGVRQYIDAGFEAIDKADKIRNNRLGKAEENIKCIKKETGFFRWVHRNPIPSAAALLILIIAGAWGYHVINIKQTVENITKIELKDADVQ